MSMRGFTVAVGTVAVVGGIVEYLKHREHTLAVHFTAPEDVTAEVTMSCPNELNHYEITANKGEFIIPVHGFSKYEFCVNEISGSDRKYDLPKPKNFRFFGNQAYDLKLS
ncbi:MAG: hypothetical protein Q4E57_05610 [Eubacteriales bacterium]|nr:hypothetical protein [Eubacteriales bacterium]